MAETFFSERYKLKPEDRNKIVARLARVSGREKLVREIEWAIAMFSAEDNNKEMVFPPAKQTVTQLRGIIKASEQLGKKLSELNISAGAEIAWHAGCRDLRVRYPLPVADLIEALKWLSEIGERGAVRYAKEAAGGRPRDYAARALAGRLCDIYPGRLGATKRSAFHNLVATVFKICGVGVNCEQVLKHVLTVRQQINSPA